MGVETPFGELSLVSLATKVLLTTSDTTFQKQFSSFDQLLMCNILVPSETF